MLIEFDHLDIYSDSFISALRTQYNKYIKLYIGTKKVKYDILIHDGLVTKMALKTDISNLNLKNKDFIDILYKDPSSFTETDFYYF